MDSPFRRIIDDTLGAVHAAAAVDIVYDPDGLAITLRAIPGRNVSETEDTEGHRVRIRRRDWIIYAADLTADGEQIEPEPGTVIHYTDLAGSTHVYEVRPPADNAPCWRWSGNGHTRRRIHATYVRTEAPE